MVPGLGHLHMNQLKTIFKILDSIILEPLGKDVLNFQSPKAYSYLVDAKDTHKSWETIQTLLYGTCMELILEFRAQRNLVQESKENSQLDEAHEFLVWISNHRNASLKFLGELILTYAFAVYLFKTGVRANDVSMIDASRMKFSGLFYAFNHPYYREVEYRDLKNRMSYREEIKSYRDKHMSYSSSTLMKKSQGGDFILEGKVKRDRGIRYFLILRLRSKSIVSSARNLVCTYVLTRIIS